MKKTFHAILRGDSSIRSMLKQSYQTIIIAMAVPTVIMTVAMLVMTARYGELIDNIDRAAEIRDLVKTQFAEEIWNIVSGKKEFDEGSQYDMINRVDEGLRDLEENSENAARYVVAAQRANDTLRTYVDALHDQIRNQAAVSLQESSYRDIVSVVGLTYTVLEQYINEELITISRLNHQIQAVALAVLVLIVMILLLVIYFAVNSFHHMRVSIYKPILELEEMTRRITNGDLDARAADSLVEELAPLTKSLNHMAGRLQQLIDERIEVGQNLQKAEMRALQAQITPHFVYNTLETIIWLAEQERNQELVDIAMAFTDFLRISLNQGKDYVTVVNEQMHVQSYLSIQSVRYHNIMTYRIDIDPELGNYPILKLLLQPLVENAIYHGIKNKRGGGHIQVTGEKNPDNTMTFTVADDGIGMTEEKLNKVLVRLRGTSLSESSGFGLYNVNRRIRLYYNRELEIDSKYGRGTSIRFTLPCREWDYD
ncbi:sensor histidine kinase [Sinanaerobacter chloroacetimidivorans]|jgi:two-component system sensor histidine kinase YesM|uniref:histidine kinase n=1 Tax=Sinanaerobacter chloroacetimidivorans TaxID=2818044 RepID=A0A8J7W456_9FIRM|nr:sensor histidine kinase [Sinanaerobacter chloroacetimidivorans]MBR0600184.1 sensor histidine kinase [Sinanaerobacter chloroacetimidivorans]